MLQWHKEGKNLHIKFVYVILMKIIKYLKKLPNVIEVKMPKGKDETFRVCGDVHGQVILSLFFVIVSTTTLLIFSINSDIPPIPVPTYLMVIPKIGTYL